VLAECEAKRRIVDLHGVAHYCATGSLQEPIAPPFFAGGDDRFPICDTLRTLALSYADHPEYPENGEHPGPPA
jgi:hypothetical protein